MAGSSSIYQRLPGTGSTLVARIRLYQGPDHLLQVESTGWTETYKRFYYRDIQALVIQQTSRGRMWNIIWGALAAFGAAIALWVDAIGWAFLPALLFAIPFGYGLYNGPTCTVQLRTAVQTERLRSLLRLRQVHQTLDRILPLIAGAQGLISRESLAEKMGGRLEDARPVTSPAPPAPLEPPAVAS